MVGRWGRTPLKFMSFLPHITFKMSFLCECLIVPREVSTYLVFLSSAHNVPAEDKKRWKVSLIELSKLWIKSSGRYH